MNGNPSFQAGSRFGFKPVPAARRNRPGNLARLPALLLALLVAAAAGARGAGAEAPGSAGPRDYTVFILSDTHLGFENLKACPVVTQEDTLAKAKAGLDTWRALVGRPYPRRPEWAGLDLATVARPAALFILGDLVDGHPEPARLREQWRGFEEVFPAAGIAFGSHRAPVQAIAGNHDGPPPGAPRRGLVERNRRAAAAGRLAALSANGVHSAFRREGVHWIFLGLCPADGTDAAAPFKYGQPGPGSWNDPEGAFSFLRDYLARQVGGSGEPVILLHHYGFDGFSLNDWNWWTPRQRRAVYDVIKDYNVAAIFHGHDHHAAHYLWPDPQRSAEDLAKMFPEGVPARLRQYDIVSCGAAGWVVRVAGARLTAVHFRGPDWNEDRAVSLAKTLNP